MSSGCKHTCRPGETRPTVRRGQRSEEEPRAELVLQELGGILTLKKTLRLQQDRWSSAQHGSCGASYQGGGRGESKLGCGCCLWERRSGIRTAASENQRQIVRVTQRFVALSQRHEKNTPSKKTTRCLKDSRHHQLREVFAAAVGPFGKLRKPACKRGFAIEVTLRLAATCRDQEERCRKKGKKKIKGICVRFFLKGSTFTRKAHPRRWRACVHANYKCMYSPIDSYHMLKSIVAVAG